MDGLTIRSAEGMIETGQTLRDLRSSSGMKSEVMGAQGPESRSFADTLKEAVNTVNALQKDSDKKMQDLATGKAKNIPEVMIASEKADIAFKLMVQVRNKIIDAYHEVMKMQV